MTERDIVSRPRTRGLSAEEHAVLITRRWSDAVQGIVGCGRALIEAKAELGHGDFTSMVEELLPFSSATARKLMTISRNTWIANRSHSERLPPQWSTLYELSRLPEDALEQAASEGRIRADMERAEAVRLRRPLASQLPPPAPLAEVGADVKYGAILADPPWPFDTWSDNGKDRSPERHYTTMSLAEICALPVAELAAEDCALFLWSVAWAAPQAYQVLASWGFSYKSLAFVWEKEGAFGNGYWTRQECEFCILATRGSPRRLNADVPQLIRAPRGAHSEKPEEAHRRIERLVAGPYIELFARRGRDGWATWGDQVDNPGVEEV